MFREVAFSNRIWDVSSFPSGVIRMTPAIHNNPIEEKYLDQMKDLVLRVTSGKDCTIVLFGSRARGVHRRSSDIDIGFSGLSDPLFTRTRDLLLAELEESIIPHHVDLVNLDTVSSNFRDVAMKEVIVWKQSSRASCLI